MKQFYYYSTMKSLRILVYVLVVGFEEVVPDREQYGHTNVNPVVAVLLLEKTTSGAADKAQPYVQRVNLIIYFYLQNMQEGRTLRSPCQRIQKQFTCTVPVREQHEY